MSSYNLNDTNYEELEMASESSTSKGNVKEGGIVRLVVAEYNRALINSPLLLNSVMGFFVATIGDIICQYVYNTNHNQNISWEWDFHRTIQMGVIRSVVIAPFIHYWYPFLVQLCPGNNIVNVFCRVAIDQTIGSILVLSTVFFIVSLLHGDVLGAPRIIYASFFPTWIRGLQFWPLVNMINFRIIPVIYQPLIAHFASIYWNIVLSYYANSSLH